jgi:hypothetical protein
MSEDGRRSEWRFDCFLLALFRYRTGVITFEFLLHSTFPKRILSNISHFL